MTILKNIKADYLEVDETEEDIALLGIKAAAAESLAKFNLANQTVDNFQDSTGIDTGASTNENLSGAAGYYHGNESNMTLISANTTAAAQPNLGDIVITYTNGAGTATLGTDLKAYITRNGSTYIEFPLVAKGTSGGHTIVAGHGLDISGAPTGTAMRYKIETLNQSASKVTRIQAVSSGWS